MKTLTLPLKREYFEAIRDGTKTEEYRLCTQYWQKRLYSPFGSYDQVVLTLGYPARHDHDRRLVRAWRGYTIKTITHPHFGPSPVQVFAIDVSEPTP
ncbi:ASCH domain-containing protein [Comamonas terrigena]|uniref:ASCH domain-containing protein n=1 Tax=Comamonas terrigena TaxID=32013 RepID=UPI00244BBAD6|nr:ASCH domain-containing protein [Comamonas terrigena]MDH1293299.1 ASCH domain-containing protein [Comamonas terrigena]